MARAPRKTELIPVSEVTDSRTKITMTMTVEYTLDTDDSVFDVLGYCDELIELARGFGNPVSAVVVGLPKKAKLAG